MRLSGRRGTSAAQRPVQYPPMITCPVCGLRNDISLRFCRNCGLPLGAPRDPVRGTTTKRADLPSDHGAGIAALLGFLVVVLVVGGAGLMVWRGFQARADTPGAPADSVLARASSVPRATPVASLPGTSLSPSSSGQPLASDDAPGTSSKPDATPRRSDESTDTPGPDRTDEPDSEPTPTPKATAAALGTVTSWSCKPTGIQDATDGRWRITRADWTPGGSYDRLTLSLSRVSGSSKTGTVVTTAFMSPGKAASTYDVARPSGDRAIVLTFDGPTSVGTAMAASPGLRVIESLDVRRDADGVTHAVVGVTGKACLRLKVADWADGTPPGTAELVLDVRP